MGSRYNSYEACVAVFIEHSKTFGGYLGRCQNVMQLSPHTFKWGPSLQISKTCSSLSWCKATALGHSQYSRPRCAHWDQYHKVGMSDSPIRYIAIHPFTSKSCRSNSQINSASSHRGIVWLIADYNSHYDNKDFWPHTLMLWLFECTDSLTEFYDLMTETMGSYFLFHLPNLGYLDQP